MEQYNIEYKDGHDIREDISHMDETRNADFICSLFEELKYTVQLRNSKSEAEDENYDRLVSPILNSSNGFYDSSDYMEKIQCNNCIRKNKLICYDKGGNPI